ncbi:hypothetical protein F4821DRAFT_231301 [Hypoxylon rubiginosum]|uniref:Uncharacterized protein n=1 Tax=Hypoxylon rubiginosum TaxID=110542 RepID=A0ACC0DAJ1_9PEZI|nr:hypothetical protein F4821DRAFT_231301 [Hypoxylon rubiginosum]
MSIPGTAGQTLLLAVSSILHVALLIKRAKRTVSIHDCSTSMPPPPVAHPSKLGGPSGIRPRLINCPVRSSEYPT